MRTAFSCASSILLAALALAAPASAQSVISTHAGLIHYFEGAVYLDGQPLESHLGRYTHMPQGADLRTEDGRAEVLLTPGVFLRMGGGSEIRMVSNQLADTQVEIKTGSVMVEAGDANSGTSVTLLHKEWKVHLLRKGLYRINSNPPELLVRDGAADVFSKASATPVSVHSGESLPFASVLVPEPGYPSTDALSDWAAGRSQSISADNTITAQIDQDPASQMPGAGDFTYFPMLGLSAPAIGSLSPYGYAVTSQPGFNSIYLPGYTYQPLVLGSAIHGLGTGVYGYGLRVNGLSPVRRPGIPSVGPGTLSPIPRAPVTLHPVPVRAGAPVGIRGAAHR